METSGPARVFTSPDCQTGQDCVQVLIRPPRAGSVPSDRALNPTRAAVASSTRPCAGHGCEVSREEPFMSIKSKVLAAAATLTLVGGIGTAGALTAGTASAATPSCGSSCIDVFSHQFGTHKSPNYVVDVLRQGEKVGQPIILFRTANFDPAEDFTVAFQGTVSDFFAAGLVSAAVDLHYGGGAKGFPDDFAFENEYAPFGVDSGLCLGVAATAFNDEGVTLQPCGVSSKTVWI